MNPAKIFRYNSRPISTWVLWSVGLMLLLGIPIYTILFGLTGGPGPNWSHLVKYLLGDYLFNSFILVLGTGFMALLWGVPSAWLVSTLEFPGRKVLEWLLILPLTIPTYIMAFTYAGIFDFTGPIQTVLRNTFGWNLAASMDIMNIQGVAMVMSLALFPYVYVISRAAFLTRYRSLIEVSQVMGVPAFRSFFKVVLPVSRPVLVAGVALVIMEVLNDYGAVKYYGVRTFTTGIFRSWFSYEDPQAAIYLSSLLLLFVFGLLILEKLQRGSARYESTVSAERPLSRVRVRGVKAFMAIAACSLPAFLGFVLPFSQLLWWAYRSYGSVGHSKIGAMTGNSFLLASGASVICVLIALILLFATRLRPGRILQAAVKLSTLGYAIPGAVIAIGVMVPFLYLDKKILGIFNSWGWEYSELILTGTIAGLLFAYAVRFLAVAFNPIESGYTALGTNLHEAALSLGAKPGRLLTKVNIPLLKTTLLSAGLLVFIDVLKELPLTLILRPFNFNTLATRAFELASDEMVASAAIPSLVIVLTGIIPIHFLNSLISRQKNR